MKLPGYSKKPSYCEEISGFTEKKAGYFRVIYP